MSFQTKLRDNLKKPKSLLETLMIAGMNKDGTYRYDHDPQSELWRTTGEKGPIKINPKMQQRIDKLKSTFPWNQVQVDYDKNMPQDYKDWSKQLQKIMGTKGGKDFIKDLFIHSQNYPRA